MGFLHVILGELVRVYKAVWVVKGRTAEKCFSTGGVDGEMNPPA